jgi:dihydropteroate synthase
MKPFSLNIKGSLREFDSPVVMGILNVTPDSFYAGSHAFDHQAIEHRVQEIIAQGADIIDIGGYSSRPGADEVSEAEEMQRIERGLAIIRDFDKSIPVSVDTFRAAVARRAIEEWGADIVNDISGGMADPAMFDTVAGLRAPYILMHMRGTPKTMQSLTGYNDVTADVVAELSKPLHRLMLKGVADVIIDPGFGFAKTTGQNYELFNNLDKIAELLERPLLVGISRKSMITRICGITPDEALPGTIALNTAAIMKGASIIRVHDVAAARQAVTVLSELTKTSRPAHQ